jgi:hypothetical protein
MQAASPKHTRVASVSSMEAVPGVCVGMQGAPPTYTHAVSVSSMEAVPRLCAGMQAAPPAHTHAVSVPSMGGKGCARFQGAPPTHMGVGYVSSIRGRRPARTGYKYTKHSALCLKELVARVGTRSHHGSTYLDLCVIRVMHTTTGTTESPPICSVRCGRMMFGLGHLS